MADKTTSLQYGPPAGEDAVQDDEDNGEDGDDDGEGGDDDVV